MTNTLTATQQSLLKTAAGCEDRAIRWPANLRGGARTKIIAALVDAGFAHNRSGSLVITEEGMRVIGAEPAPKAKPTGRAKTGSKQGSAKAPRPTRADSKQAQLIAMLKRKEGASIDEIAKAFDWQPHTVRGVIAGVLKKKLGLEVTSEKVEGRGRVYAIRAEG
ncbi:MAG: DUF3489 domain-containing protein [Alphaproteobacteria bacterium]|nr:DUF3489 domain-containing protein [Alphaproteobacteria bacterium]